jgi:hypothetical protein
MSLEGQHLDRKPLRAITGESACKVSGAGPATPWFYEQKGRESGRFVYKLRL